VCVLVCVCVYGCVCTCVFMGVVRGMWVIEHAKKLCLKSRKSAQYNV
jgi:hypothetical protein